MFFEHKPTRCFFLSIEQWDIHGIRMSNQFWAEFRSSPGPFQLERNPLGSPHSHHTYGRSEAGGDHLRGGRGSGDEVAIGPRAEAGRLDLCEWGAERLRAAVGSCRSFCERSPSDGRCTGGRGGSALRRLRRARQDALRAVFPGQHPLDEMRKPHSVPPWSLKSPDHTFNPFAVCLWAIDLWMLSFFRA